MIEVVPQSVAAPLDLEKMFGRIAPLQIDLGCGEGSFLCELAAQHPEKNFLGIERLSGRVAKACRKAGPSRTGGKIDNVHILQIETSHAVRYLLPPRSVETFYLLFPDPWPKRRHHPRRIVTLEFIDSICTALEENGLLHIATDHADYFKQITQLTGASPGFATADPGGFEFPLTKFEKRFRAQGAPIYRLSLRKISPVT
ncbi:MAG: tRNA (guanosine(46)-N7)-methyltransferase TrmB [Chthoniobacterales bacterium]